jgi:hypothetical protein
VRHTTEECELNPNKQDKRLCKYKCGSAYTTGHNCVCEKRQANKDKTMPSVTSVQIQDSSAVTKKHNAKQALLPQCDTDRGNSSRRLYKGKPKLVYRHPTQGREVRIYDLKAQQYSAAVRDQEERDRAERRNDAQATLLAMPSTSSTRAMPTALRENADLQVVEHHQDIDYDAKL